MADVKREAEQRMKRAVAALGDEFKAVRTGRASSALFDRVTVEAYGQQTPLNQVATISVPEARLVVIQPWDRSLLAEIEKALQKSDLSVNPTNDGKIIRIAIPPLTEERRQELVRIAKNMGEQSRVAIRNVRRDINEDIKKQQKSSDISEDDAKRLSDEVQKLTDTYIGEISTVLEAKEKEILEV